MRCIFRDRTYKGRAVDMKIIMFMVLVLLICGDIFAAAEKMVYITSEGRSDGYSLHEEYVTREEFVAHGRQDNAKEKRQLAIIKSYGPPVIGACGRLSYIDPEGHGTTFVNEKGQDITVEEHILRADFDGKKQFLDDIENQEYEIIATESEFKKGLKGNGKIARFNNKLKLQAAQRATEHSAAQELYEHYLARKQLKEKRGHKMEVAGVIRNSIFKAGTERSNTKESKKEKVEIREPLRMLVSLETR